MPEPQRLRALAPDLWIHEAPLRLAGSDVGTRMTVVRLGDGGLVLIAPTPIDDALERKIRELGPVRALIAPNLFHHFYFADAADRFPEADSFIAPGLGEKVSGLPQGARELEADPDPLWESDLEQCAIPGAPKVAETVFFHRASRTLILTDFCFNFDPAPTGWTGIFTRLAGAHGCLSVSRLMRFMLKDRTSLRSAVEKIQAWEFDRIIVTHGNVLVTDARERFAVATAGL